MHTLALRRAIALILFVAAPSIAHAQDANKILDDSIKAAGGSRQLSKLQTLAIEGTLTR